MRAIRISMTFFLLLLACTIVSCKQKSETVDIEKIELECENHGDLYDSCIYFDTTSDWKRTWIQLTPLDSIERVICRYKGYVELDDTSFVVQIPDVLRYCPEKQWTTHFLKSLIQWICLFLPLMIGICVYYFGIQDWEAHPPTLPDIPCLKPMTELSILVANHMTIIS